MIPFIASGFCYLAFVLFESFAVALDRLSPIKTRGLLEEHPERARILSGPGEVEIIRTTTKVLVQILLLAGLLTVVSGFESFGVEPAWAWGGGVFLVGWLLSEVALLKYVATADPERIASRLLPVVTAAPGFSCRSRSRSARSSPNAPPRRRRPPQRPTKRSRPTSTSGARRGSSRRTRRNSSCPSSTSATRACGRS
jgi:hypothetical protein